MALEAALRRRLGTRYDVSRYNCWTFLTEVLDEVHGITATPLPVHVRWDTTIHNAGKVQWIIRSTARRYEDVFDQVQVDVRELAPGDVILAQPGHAMIRGVEKNQLWHCSAASGVCYCGVVGVKIMRAWRPKWTS